MNRTVRVGIILSGIALLVIFVLRSDRVRFGADSDHGDAPKVTTSRRSRGNPADHLASSARDLAELMEEADQAWLSEGHRYRELKTLRRELLSNWTEREVELACRELFPCEWEELLFERWGSFDHEEAIAHILGLPDEFREDFENAGRSLEVGAGEATVEAVGMVLNAALAGWAGKDPESACLAIVDPEGEILSSEAFGGYGYLAPIPMFESLSSLDARLARELFQKEGNPLFSGSMLKGMSRGLPEGQDWLADFESFMASPNGGHRDVVAVLRGSLLARWMEEDVEGAVKWFRSEEGKAISVERKEVSNGDLFEIPLASAARHWIARDQAGAFAWIRQHPEIVPEILKGGNWLDPDRVSSADLRLMIAGCVDDSDREGLLRPLIGKWALSELLNRNDDAILLEEISGLQLTREFAEELFKEHLRNESDPFVD
ncbi:hypothetical protein V2O64_02825 [Verrucomicrobiaceae bacterium 227]